MIKKFIYKNCYRSPTDLVTEGEHSVVVVRDPGKAQDLVVGVLSLPRQAHTILLGIKDNINKDKLSINSADVQKDR